MVCGTATERSHPPGERSVSFTSADGRLRLAGTLAVAGGSGARALIREFGKSDWTIGEIAGMNHAFQRCETGMPDEYTSTRQVMADQVVEAVAGWIAGRTRA